MIYFFGVWTAFVFFLGIISEQQHNERKRIAKLRESKNGRCG
jgi:hypothetical protein